MRPWDLRSRLAAGPELMGPGPGVPEMPGGLRGVGPTSPYARVAGRAGVTPEEIAARAVTPWVTPGRVGGRIQAAWEPLRKPEAWELRRFLRAGEPEGYELPGAPGPVVPQRVAGQRLGVTRGGRAGVVPLTAEQQAAAAQRAAAVRHDIGEVPVVGPMVKGIGAGLKTGIELLSAPALAVEEMIGRPAQRVRGGLGLPSLTPRKHVTPEQEMLAQQISPRTDLQPPWMQILPKGVRQAVARQGVLALARRDEPSIRQYAAQAYGEGEQTEQALARLAAGLGYSSYEAQRKGLDRLMAGEDLEAVIGGREVDTYKPSEEDVAAFGMYIEGVRQREGDDAAAAAAQRVKETGMIPGESDTWNELIFQVGLDPLNLLDIGTWKRGIEARKAAAAGKFATEAAGYADEVAQGAKVALDHVDEAAKVTGRVDDQTGMLRRFWDKVNPLAPTPRAAAETAAGTAYQVVTPAVLQAESADEARAVVRAMVEDPGRLQGILGNVPVSQAAEEARPLLTVVVGDLDDAKKFPSLAAGEFNRFDFMADLDAAVAERAMEAAGVGAEKVSKYQQFANGFRSTMSEFYLRTPGYAIRNAMGDLVTMGVDGVASLDGVNQIDDFLKRFGPTTRRVGEGVAAGAQVGEMAAESKLPGVFGKVSAGLGRWVSAQEEGRYTRAFYTSLKRTLPDVWQPRLPEELAQALDPQMVQQIERGLAQGMNADEFADVVKRAAGEGPRLMDVGRYLDNPDDLSVGLRLHVEGELGKIDSVDQVDEVIDGAQALAREQAGRAFAADPTPPGRRVWSDFEAVQDLREEQGWVEGLGQAMGVEGDEAARASQQLADALAPGEAGIREAEERLAAAVASGFDEDSATLVRQVRAETGQAKAVARSTADQLRARAWREYRSLLEQGQADQAGRVWQDYFSQVGQVHQGSQQWVLGRLEDGIDQVGRLRAGQPLEAITGRSTKAIVEESLGQLRALAGDVAGRQDRLRRMGLEDFVDFDKMLDAQRLTVDTAEAEAWRLMAVNPTRDGLDIVMGTQDGVDRLARAMVNELASIRQMFLNHVIDREKYTELGNKIAGGFFRDASQGWDLARWEVSQLPLSPGSQQRALQSLGWSVDEVAKLGADQVQAVLGTGVRWDPLLGGPTMPIEEAMRGTVGEVAGMAGLDLTRSADWGVDEWEQVQQAAARLRNEAGGRAGVGERVARAAVEEVAEAAAGAPKTVAAGMELRWPESVDDVARTMGVRPQTASAEDWARVAEYAEQQGQAGMMGGTEFGRRSAAAQEAQRLPEWGQVGGQERMVRRGRVSFTEEQARVAELGTEARKEAEGAVDWVLGEAGFGEGEIGKLTWQQKQKLTEEIGQGELLRTGSGRPSKIDAIDAERRTELLGGLGGEVREAAFGVAMDPEAAGAYRWMEVAEEAQRRAQGAQAVVQPPGLYDARGFPVRREAAGRARPGQRAVVERAVEMVPEPERLGRGRAFVGFEQRQAQLAERYADIEDMARARKGLLQEGRRIGEGVDVPAGAVKAATRKEHGIYLLDLVDEEKRVVGTYGFDSYADVRKARDEAREVIKAGRQGQGAMTGTAWSRWGTEDVARADRRAAAAGGYANPPTLADMAAVQSERELKALEDVREWVKADWGVQEEMGVLPPDVRRRLDGWIKGDMTRQWNESRTVGVEMARQQADFALLDYSGGRKRFDNWLSTVAPYSFWMTRSGRNWALRAAERPGLIAQYKRYQDALQRSSQERGYRGRFEGQIEVPVRGMPEWTGQAVFFDPTRILMPWAGLPGMKSDWGAGPEDADNVIEAMYTVGQKIGLRPYGFIEWPLQYYGWIGKKEEIGYVLPHTGAVQAVTAAAGVGPPGGVSIEAPLRRGLGMPEQEPYGVYRVSRMLGNMAADSPEISQMALQAQELASLVESGELRMEDALNRDVPRALERIAREQNWTPAQLEQAQDLLEETVRRAGLERGLRTGTSFFTGVGLSMYPRGERRQVELEREERGRMYSPLTETGGRAEMQAWQREHPETVPRRLARAALPGAGEYEGWRPGEAWQSNEYKRRSGEVDATYDAAVDDLLKRDPWNKEGVRELEDQRKAELDVLRDELGIGESFQPEREAGYRPRSTYGASPEETTQIRREEVMAAISSAMPHVGDFADEEGQPDYDAYNVAVTQFFADLPSQMGADERMAAIGQEMGQTPAQLLEGVGQGDVQAYWRRNDRPTEAAQRVWEETVYGPAWEAYNRAVESGMQKGEAYEKTVEAAGAVTGRALIARIQEMYPDRWTREELTRELGGMRFPGVGEASTMRKPAEERAMAEASGAFWDFLNEGLPPGRMANEARNNKFVQIVLDGETRGTATAEQYQKAMEALEGWAAQNRDASWGTPQEWTQARQLNEQLQAQIDEAMPEIGGVLAQYYELDTAGRRAFRQEHPEIGQYYDMKDAFGAQPGNEVWAKFYGSGAGAMGVAAAGGGGYARAGGAAAAAGTLEEQFVKGAYKLAAQRWPGIFDTQTKYFNVKDEQGAGAARAFLGEHPELKQYWDFMRVAKGGQQGTPRYGGGGGKWRGGGGGGFGYLASRTPRTYLETPSAWEGAIRGEYQQPYRARGVPWVVGTWKRSGSKRG